MSNDKTPKGGTLKDEYKGDDAPQPYDSFDYARYLHGGGPGSGRKPSGAALESKYHQLGTFHRQQADLHQHEFEKAVGNQKPPFKSDPVRSYHGDMMHYHKSAARQYENAASYHSVGLSKQGAGASAAGNRYAELAMHRTPPEGAKSFEGRKMAATAPPGFKNTVERMKKHKEISNPFALAWWEKDQGDTPHPKKMKAGGPGSGRYPAGSHMGEDSSQHETAHPPGHNNQSEMHSALLNQGYKELPASPSVEGNHYYHKDNNKFASEDGPDGFQPSDKPRNGALDHDIRVDKDGTWHHMDSAGEGGFGKTPEEFYAFDKDQEREDATYPESKTYKAPAESRPVVDDNKKSDSGKSNSWGPVSRMPGPRPAPPPVAKGSSWDYSKAASK